MGYYEATFSELQAPLCRQRAIRVAQQHCPRSTEEVVSRDIHARRALHLIRPSPHLPRASGRPSIQPAFPERPDPRHEAPLPGKRRYPRACPARNRWHGARKCPRARCSRPEAIGRMSCCICPVAHVLSTHIRNRTHLQFDQCRRRSTGPTIGLSSTPEGGLPHDEKRSLLR